MSFRGRGGAGRGGGGFSRGGGRGGGRGGFQQSYGPPEQVFAMGEFKHSCEGDLVCRAIHEQSKIPYFNAPIYLENKTQIGKVDEILGPINETWFTIKPQEGIQAASFKAGDKFFIAGDKLLPMEKFMPKPKPLPGTKPGRTGQQGRVEKRGGRGGGGRGGFAGRGGPGRGGFSRGGGRGGPRGGAGRGGPGRGGFSRGRGRGGY